MAVRGLLENGADVDVKATDGHGTTALHWAVNNEHLEIVKALLQEGAEVNAKDSFGITALHWAVRRRSLKSVRALIQKEAEVNAKENDGTTALHLAAECGALEILKELLQKGADINAVDKNGRTALAKVGSNTPHGKEIVAFLKAAAVKDSDSSVDFVNGHTEGRLFSFGKNSPTFTWMKHLYLTAKKNLIRR